MAMFVSIVEGPPYDLKIEPRSDEDGQMISVPIAKDDQGRIVFVETLLSPAVVEGFEHHEIVFQITVISVDDSFESLTTQMREVAKAYIPDNCRNHVMQIVCDSCAKLIESMSPALIYAVTKEGDLPPKAMERYDTLNNTVQECGYTLYEVGTDDAGRSFWKWTAPYDPADN
jgi:hypothetical protein